MSNPLSQLTPVHVLTTPGYSRIARGSVRNTKVEWLVVLQIHMLVTAGLALVAVGVSSLYSSKSSSDSAMGLLKAGFAIMFVGWGIIVGFCMWSYRRPASYGLQVESVVFRDGTIVRCARIINKLKHPWLTIDIQLLNAVSFSLPFILLRAIYGALNLFGSGDSIGNSSFSSNVAANVIMDVLAQLIAVIIFVIAGFRTVMLGAGISRDVKLQSYPL